MRLQSIRSHNGSWKHSFYGCVSQVLGTIEFTNLISFDWLSRFSHLDRLHFAVKKFKTKYTHKKKVERTSKLRWN